MSLVSILENAWLHSCSVHDANPAFPFFVWVNTTATRKCNTQCLFTFRELCSFYVHKLCLVIETFTALLPPNNVKIPTIQTALWRALIHVTDSEINTKLCLTKTQWNLVEYQNTSKRISKLCIYTSLESSKVGVGDLRYLM